MVNLGINVQSYMVKEAIIRGDKSIILPCGTELWLEHRDPDAKAKLSRFKYMYDLAEAAVGERDHVVDEAHGFYVVSNNQSVLFYSGGM